MQLLTFISVMEVSNKHLLVKARWGRAICNTEKRQTWHLTDSRLWVFGVKSSKIILEFKKHHFINHYRTYFMANWNCYQFSKLADQYIIHYIPLHVQYIRNSASKKVGNKINLKNGQQYLCIISPCPGHCLIWRQAVLSTPHRGSQFE